MKQSASEAGIPDALREAVDGASAGRVFGEPISHAGVIVLPAAKVSGGAGRGTGPAEEGREPGGTGSGFGLSAKPLGVFVIREDGKVQWQPAIDVNRVIMGGQIIALAALLVVRAFRKARGAGGMGRRGALRSTGRLHLPKRLRH
jgi:Sporulation protein YtfJ (Spore_YtfJ)